MPESVNISQTQGTHPGGGAGQGAPLPRGLRAQRSLGRVAWALHVGLGPLLIPHPGSVGALGQMTGCKTGPKFLGPLSTRQIMTPHQRSLKIRRTLTVHCSSFMCGLCLAPSALGLGGLLVQESCGWELASSASGQGGPGLRGPHRSSGSSWLCEHNLALKAILGPVRNGVHGEGWGGLGFLPLWAHEAHV